MADVAIRHPTAVIDPDAKLADDVAVGAYTVIGADVEIGPGTVIGPHCSITGPTTIGRDNRIHGHAAIGGDPQDKKFRGERVALEIGDGNQIREFVTINRGTGDGGGITRVGDRNWILAYTHVAHDCTIGNDCVFSNNATLAGHVSVGDWAILGGFTGVHQFVRVGAHSFCGVGTVLLQDLPPFVTVSGNPAAPHGINSEGLKRRGFSSEAVMALKRAYRAIYKSGLTLEEAKAKLEEESVAHPEIQLLLDFLGVSKRGIVR